MKSPFLHALTAVLYITVIASAVTYGASYIPEPPQLLAITIFLSLFTFSAATMCYLFFWRPLTLLLQGDEKRAARFFFSTLGAFGTVLLALGLILALTA